MTTQTESSERAGAGEQDTSEPRPNSTTRPLAVYRYDNGGPMLGINGLQGTIYARTYPYPGFDMQLTEDTARDLMIALAKQFGGRLQCR